MLGSLDMNCYANIVATALVGFDSSSAQFRAELPQQVVKPGAKTAQLFGMTL